MSSLSNRIKFSVFGFVTLWIFARTVFAADLLPHASRLAASTATEQAGVTEPMTR